MHIPLDAELFEEETDIDAVLETFSAELIPLVEEIEECDDIMLDLSTVSNGHSEDLTNKVGGVYIPKKGSSQRKAYVSNANLLVSIRESRTAGSPNNDLIRMWQLMVGKLASKNVFLHYSYKEDMCAEAIVVLYRNGLKFNELRSSNPFSFYTSTILNSFYAFLNAERKQRNIRDQLLTDNGSSCSYSFTRDNDDYDGYGSDSSSGVNDINYSAPKNIKIKKQVGRKPNLRPDFLSY